MVRKRWTYIRAFLECREPDGSTAFHAISEVLRSPDLQDRCIEERTLRGIIKRLTASDDPPGPGNIN